MVKMAEKLNVQAPPYVWFVDVLRREHLLHMPAWATKFLDSRHDGR